MPGLVGLVGLVRQNTQPPPVIAFPPETRPFTSDNLYYKLMKLCRYLNLGLVFLVFCLLLGCANNEKSKTHGVNRNDGAKKLNIKLAGSHQNPAFSPSGKSILFTNFKKGYNKEPADLLIFSQKNKKTRKLVADKSANVNLPGSAWNPITNKIVFSSSRGPHDEIYIINYNFAFGSEMRVTKRAEYVAYEPSLSPDGKWVVFESHRLDEEGNGIIMKYKIDGTSLYTALTDENEDCRQPNWSPMGNKILYQKLANNRWDIWVMDKDGANPKKVTNGAGDKTDASFSPDGKRILYSSDESNLEYANLFIIPTSGGKSRRVTKFSGYDGAPSFSPDGKKIAFESYPGDPDGSNGTSLWIISSDRREVKEK